jgi:hypothetical protein
MRSKPTAKGFPCEPADCHESRHLEGPDYKIWDVMCAAAPRKNGERTFYASVEPWLCNAANQSPSAVTATLARLERTGWIIKLNKEPRRGAELEELHGYDTKYAMHVIRLYGEAKELMENGRITLPRPNRDELIEIRKGKYSLAEIQELGRQLEIEALAAQTSSPLPDRVDRLAISNLLTDVQLQLWSESSLGPGKR